MPLLLHVYGMNVHIYCTFTYTYVYGMNVHIYCTFTYTYAFLVSIHTYVYCIKQISSSTCTVDAYLSAIKVEVGEMYSRGHLNGILGGETNIFTKTGVLKTCLHTRTYVQYACVYCRFYSALFTPILFVYEVRVCTYVHTYVCILL